MWPSHHLNNHRKPSNPMVAPKYVATTLFDRQWTTQWISDPKNVRKQSKAMVPQQKKQYPFIVQKFHYRFSLSGGRTASILRKLVLSISKWKQFWFAKFDIVMAIFIFGRTWMGGFCVILHNSKWLEYWDKKIGSNNQMIKILMKLFLVTVSSHLFC